MNIRKVLFVTGLLLAGTVLFAQSNEIIDDVLSQDKLTCGNGAYLVLTASGMIKDSAFPEEAMAFIRKKGWIGEKRVSEDEMSLGEYSFVIMKSFSMSGGLMYTVFPSPRYASRELGYLGYISRDSGAYRGLKGSEALSILGQIIREMGD